MKQSNSQGIKEKLPNSNLGLSVTAFGREGFGHHGEDL